MSSSLPDLQKERGFPHPSKKKKLLKSKRESTLANVSNPAFQNGSDTLIVLDITRYLRLTQGEGRCRLLR
jgi:hypothetical protein